jgi:hypothetical protein
VRTNRIFGYDTAREMLNVHLYFVKLFGCHVAGNDIPIDTTRFASAILQGKAHPNIYLRFGCAPMFAGQPMTGISDMWITPTTEAAPCTFATWFYYVDGVAINVMYAVDGEKRQGLVGAWHPRIGTNRLAISDV